MSSLASDFKSTNELVAANEITTNISALLIDDIHKITDRIKLSN